MNKKTIKVDLSLFFNDERKMSCVFVDPNWKTVECLQRRVELLFGISSVWFLNDGCYLPSKEPIEIIKCCDVLKAFVLKESHEVRKKKKSKKFKETLEKSNSEATLSEQNTAKNAIDELVTSTHGSIVSSPVSLKTNKLLEEIHKEDDLSRFKNPGNLSKKRKSDRDEMTTSPFSKLASSTLLDSNSSLEECDNIASSNLLNDGASLGVSNHGQQLFSSKNPSNSFKKQKSVSDEMMSSTYLSKISSSTFLNESKLMESCNNNQQLSNSKNCNNPFKKCKSGKAHIYFDDIGDVASSKSKKVKNSLSKTDTKSGTIVVFRCPLNDLTKSDSAEPQKPRIFNLKSKNSRPKHLIEIQEDILISPHSNQNSKNELSSNEATTVNNVNQDTIEADAFNNSPTAQTEDEEQITFKNVNNGSQNEETNKNETEKESMAIKDVTEASNVLVETEFSIVDEAQNESQEELSMCVDGNNSDMAKTADTNHTDSQTTLTYAEDQASELKDEPIANQFYVNDNSVMSVDCIDLSIDVEDEGALQDDIKEQHNFTSDNERNKSSTSDVEEVSEIIDLNETDNNCSSTLNNSQQQNTSFKEIKVENILPLSRDITDLPKAEDGIIFKVPYKTSKTYACTNFIAGKVEYVNKRTKSIKVVVLDGISELYHIPTNLFCNLDDSTDGINKRLRLKFTEMIEPKLFSMS